MITANIESEHGSTTARYPKAVHTANTPANLLQNTFNQIFLDRTAQTGSVSSCNLLVSVHRSLASNKLATPAAAPTAPLRPQLPQAPSSCPPIPKQQPRCMRHWSRNVLLKISVQNTTSADLASFSGPHSHATSKANRQTKCSTMLPNKNAEIPGTQYGG